MFIDVPDVHLHRGVSCFYDCKFLPDSCVQMLQERPGTALTLVKQGVSMLRDYQSGGKRYWTTPPSEHDQRVFAAHLLVMDQIFARLESQLIGVSFLIVHLCH